MHDAISLAIPTIIILIGLFYQSSRFETRFAAMDAKLGSLETKLDSKMGSVDAKLDSKMGGLDAKIDASASSLRSEIQAARFELHNDIGELVKLSREQGERIARLESHPA